MTIITPAPTRLTIVVPITARCQPWNSPSPPVIAIEINEIPRADPRYRAVLLAA